MVRQEGIWVNINIYMRKNIFILTLVVIFISSAVSFFFDNRPKSLISPLVRAQRILGVNLWFPGLNWESYPDAPNISAKAALFVETKSGQPLYSKNTKERLPVASLVKVMTALVALEHKELDDKYAVSERAAEAEPDKMLLIAGEQLSLKELLYGIFLISANDAAEVLAEGTTGDRDQFTKLMNDKAGQLRLTDSYFANPTGLDEDGNNSYSSAYDLAILSRYLIRNYPEVVEISKTPYIFIPQTKEHQSYEMWTGINLLTTYEGVVGFKTGYTPEAGYTIVTLARKNGQEILGVLLGSGYRRDETRILLDYSFKKLGL